MQKLDELIRHPERIPPEWRGRSVFIKETMHIGSCGNTCVYCVSYHSPTDTWSYSVMDVSWCRSIRGALYLDVVPDLMQKSPVSA